jgi:hypothetical protein
MPCSPFVLDGSLRQTMGPGQQSRRIAMSIHHPLHPGPQRTDEPTPLEQREFLSLMMARVADAFVRPPFYVDAALDLVSVCRLLAQAGQTNTLVRDGQRSPPPICVMHCCWRRHPPSCRCATWRTSI